MPYRKIFILAILVVVFLLMLNLNHFTTYLADDFAYRYIFSGELPTHQLKEIGGLNSILVSQYQHYLIKNGRFVAHTIVQFFMQYPKLVFNLFNSLAFVVLGLLVDLLGKFFLKRKTTAPSMLVFIFISLWFILPEFGASVLWLSGACNYLWTALIYLLFIYFNLKKRSTTIFTVLLASILGFATGATNENSGPAAVLIVLLFIGCDWLFQHIKPQVPQLLSIGMAAVGFGLMMASPGSQNRGQMTLTVATIVRNTRDMFNMSAQQFSLWYLVIILLLVFLFYEKVPLKSPLQELLIFLTAHLASLYALVLSPQHPLRTMFGAALFLLIPIVSLMYQALANIKRPLKIVGLLLFGLLFLAGYQRAFTAIQYNYQETQQQVAIFKRHRNENVTVKLLTPIKKMHNPYGTTRGLNDTADDWANQWVAAYYQVHSITGKR